MDKKVMLMQLIQQYEDGNKTRFAKRIGLTPQGISTWLSRGTIDYELVYANCEYLNAAWLLTGEGPMLLSDGVPTVSATQSTVTSGQSDTVMLRLMDKLDEKDTLLKEKEAKIDQLQSELRTKSEELAVFKAKYPQYEPQLEASKDDTKGLDHAKDASTKKTSSLNADNATSATVR